MKKNKRTLISLKTVIIAIIAIKVLVLIVGSYPFDFATYVYQARSYFEYGINPLFSWNKGIPLLLLFYSQYSVYQCLINLFHSGLESTLLLHVVFKLPFLLFDLLSAYFLYLLALPKVGERKNAIYIAMLWLLNPFTLWSVEFHGSYAISATFCSILSLYLITKRRYGLSMVFLALSTSIYYYAAIFVPFYLLYTASENRPRKYRAMIRYGAVYAGSILVFYLPYLFSGKILLGEFLDSLLNHSAPNASSYAAAIQLPGYSLLKVPYYLITHHYPTNLSAPSVFKFVQDLTFISLGFIVVYALWRFKNYLKQKVYTYDQMLVDLLVTVTVFLICVGEFQDHYLVWIFPYMLLVGLRTESKHLLRYTYYISFVAFLGVLGAGNVGIYLLDILPFGTVSLYPELSPFCLALGGFTVLVLLCGNFFHGKPALHPRINWDVEDRVTLLLVSVVFIFMAGLSIAALKDVDRGGSQKSLGSDQNVYSFLYTPTSSSYKVLNTSYRTIPIKDSNFAADNYGNLQPNKLINSSKSPWFFYNYGNSAISASIVKNANLYSQKSLEIKPTALNAAAQLNMGGSGSPNLIAVNSHTTYDASVYFLIKNLPMSVVKASVRFADYEGRIIPGSDLVLTHNSKKDGVDVRSLQFTPNKNDKYIELLFSVAVGKKTNISPQSSIVIENYSFSSVKQLRGLDFNNIQLGSNSAAITRYVLKNPAATQYFKYEVQIPAPPPSGYVQSVAVGSCVQQNSNNNSSQQNTKLITMLFNTSCARNLSVNNVKVNLVNYGNKKPLATVTLTHIFSESQHIKYHKLMYFFLLAVGITLSLTLLLIVIKILLNT